MKSFFSQRRKRFTAAVTLFVWLLALGTGMANACLVQEDHARHGHLSHEEASGMLMTASGMDALADDHGTLPEKAACQNFCGAEQATVIKQQVDSPAHLDAALVVAAIWWQGSSSTVGASQVPLLVDPVWSEPPVFIRFLRLTI
jgi:hypothetical protein